MTDIQTFLQKIGLTATEAKIYLAGLSYDRVSVNELVKQTQINRTTIYHALDTLKQKGLTSRINHLAKTYFLMTPPANLTRLYDEKIAILEMQKAEMANLIPFIQPTADKMRPIKVTHYEGIEEIKLAVEEALYCHNNHWDIIAPKNNFFSEFNRDYAKYFMTARKQRGLSARSLWEADISHRHIETIDIAFRHPRILPPIMHNKFKSIIILFDNKTLLLSSVKEKSAIIIESQDLHETFSAVFEGLYTVSQPINTQK
ncbi:TPA: hypothetical protein DF272_00640 [Candidatus Falkowbacteria bacterium]|nr:hypothetical protein [Candidatus Falkowbacteria bacterium]